MLSSRHSCLWILCQSAQHQNFVFMMIFCCCCWNGDDHTGKRIQKASGNPIKTSKIALINKHLRLASIHDQLLRCTVPLLISKQKLNQAYKLARPPPQVLTSQVYQNSYIAARHLHTANLGGRSSHNQMQTTTCPAAAALIINNSTWWREFMSIQ